MLYGRDAERSRIEGLLDAARDPRSGTLVLRGEAGIGKSSLLDHAQRYAHDLRVVRVHGITSETPLAYAALHRVVRALRDNLPALPTPQAEAIRVALGEAKGGTADRFLVSLATLSLLAAAADERPLVCLVDDAHLLDEASADALVFTARRLEAEGVVLLFAARDGGSRRFEAPDLPELRLGGLEPAAAAALLERHGPSPLPTSLRDRLIAETGGNPLALLELPSHLDESHLAGDASMTPLPIGARLERAYLDRVQRLPEASRSLVLVAAADDTGDLAVVLRAAAHLGVEADALDAAEQEGLLRVDGERVAFEHPLVCSAVYHAAAPSQRRTVHAGLAEALRAEAHADRRAWHLAAATLTPAPEVVAALDAAAAGARRRSDFATASRAFERAAALCDAEEERAARLAAAGEAAWLAGRRERATTLLGAADESGPDEFTRADIRRWLGLIELTSGSPADVGPRLLHAAREVARHDPRRSADLLHLASVASVYAGDRHTASAVARAAERLPTSGSSLDRMLVDLLVGLGHFFDGDLSASARHLRAALEQERTTMLTVDEQPTALLVAGRAALFLGDDEAVRRSHRRAADHARTRGAVGLLTQILPRLAAGDLWAGRWGAAAANAREGLRLARELQQHDLVAYSLVLLALLAAHRGEEDECRTLAAEGRALASTHGFVLVTEFADWALTLLELGRGEHAAAFLRARDITQSGASYWAALDRIEAAAQGGDRAAAERWLDDVEAWSRATDAAWTRAIVHHGRALLAVDLGGAESEFRASLAAHEQASRPFERARTCLAFGALLRRSRRRVDSRDHLRAAFDTFDVLGATTWAERAHRELRASGETARRRGPGTTERLTPQELQVAQFVARGLTNREVAAQLFLSPRTVAFHLRNVFRKLGVTSRSELAHLRDELERSGGRTSAAER